jgi:hypothetical protein
MRWKVVARKEVYGHTMINPPTAVRFSCTKFSSEQDVRCEHAAQQKQQSKCKFPIF